MQAAAGRARRVADQIQRELALLIQTEVRDPRVGMVSVTGVDLSADLARARVYVTRLDGPNADPDRKREEAEACLAALDRAAGYLRGLLARRLSTRTVPALRFLRDGSAERGRRLSGLIDEALAADRRPRG